MSKRGNPFFTAAYSVAYRGIKKNSFGFPQAEFDVSYLGRTFSYTTAASKGRVRQMLERAEREVAYGKDHAILRMGYRPEHTAKSRDILQAALKDFG